MRLQPILATFRSRPASCFAIPIPSSPRLIRRPSRICVGSAPSSSAWSCGSRAYSVADSESGLRQPQDDKTKEEGKKKSDPLRILFCGSDDFSCASLDALQKERERNPELIRSIDVVVRPGKRTGRGLKTVQHPPLRDLASNLGLPIHERDTFTGWDMPSNINLIIAVSFGLFVPPRLLNAAKYGGLNVHPSLLPDLRGPAPLEHTLLAGRPFTGVTLQTLHHQTFDHGVVLAQTPADPADPTCLHIPARCTLAQLREQVKGVASSMLVRGLRTSLHVLPLRGCGWASSTPGPQSRELLHAPKITKADRQIKMAHLPTLARRQRAIGPLWFYSSLKGDPQSRVRVIVTETEEVDLEPTELVQTHEEGLEWELGKHPQPPNVPLCSTTKTPAPAMSRLAGNGDYRGKQEEGWEKGHDTQLMNHLQGWVPLVVPLYYTPRSQQQQQHQHNEAATAAAGRPDHHRQLQEQEETDIRSLTEAQAIEKATNKVRDTETGDSVDTNPLASGPSYTSSSNALTMILWRRRRASNTDVDGDGRGRGSPDDESMYIGSCRIDKLKVEGRREESAVRAVERLLLVL
ncbi:Formyltransferase [Xylariomycetidae sp. FL2044]|nr:Formyltransferase [Xylariomycetidae sp. FL2044]